MQIQFDDTDKSLKENNKLKNIFDRDQRTTLFVAFSLTIDILMIINNEEQQIFPIIACGFNGLISLKLLTRPKSDNELFPRICLFASKLTTLLMIPLIDLEAKMLLIALFQTLDSNQVDENQFRFIEAMTIKIGSLIIMVMDFNIITLISLIFSILIECNNFNMIINLKKKKIPKIDNFTASLISQQEQENLWKYRIQMIPVSFFMINAATLKINFKNKIALQYFSLFCETENDIDELILNNLSFSLLQDNLDQFQSFSHLKFRQRLRSRQPNNSIQKEIQKPEILYGQALNSILSHHILNTTKQVDTSDPLPLTYSLLQIITSIKKGEFKEYIINNSIELFCQQTWTSTKRFQLSGQLLINSKDDEIILLLNDMSKQNELHQLISKDEFKSKMIESFSHELRTPINSAINFLSAAVQDQLTSERTKNDLIIPAINALKIQSHLISDIIDFSQNHANNFELNISDFTISELINEITQLFQIQLSMKQLEFSVDLLDCFSTVIFTDQCRLMQILVNLLQNSIKFSSNGLVVLKISSLSKEQLKITVIDMGQGIASDRLVQIQQVLASIEQHKDYQFDQTWEGFGLLISAILVSKLAPLENTKIRIESNGSNCGTKVTFHITNYLKKQLSMRQNTIRQNSQRLLTSPNHQNCNGSIIQVDAFSKNKFKSTIRNSVKSNENSLFSESIVSESLDQKLGLLLPIQPFFITEIACSPNKNKGKSNTKYENSSQGSKIMSIAFIRQGEEQEEEENLQTYKRKKKCNCSRIMSVDDEIFNQKSIQILLSILGFDVILAFNGEEACNQITRLKKCGKNCQLLTLIIMDYQMPIMDGCQATKKLIKMMSDNLIPKIHIIGLTAFTSSSDIGNCISAGMSDVLNKPLNLKEFKEILSLI